MTTFTHEYRVVKPGTYSPDGGLPETYFEDTSGTKRLVNSLVRHYSQLQAYSWGNAPVSSFSVDQFGTLTVVGNHVYSGTTKIAPGKYPLYLSSRMRMFTSSLDGITYDVNTFPDINAATYNSSVEWDSNTKSMQVNGIDLELTLRKNRASSHNLGYFGSQLTDYTTMLESYIRLIITAKGNQRVFDGTKLVMPKGDNGIYATGAYNMGQSFVHQWVSWGYHNLQQSPLFYLMDDPNDFGYKHLCLGRSSFRMPVGSIVFTDSKSTASFTGVQHPDRYPQVYTDAPYDPATLPMFNAGSTVRIPNSSDMKKLFPWHDEKYININIHPRRREEPIERAPSKYAGLRFVNVVSKSSVVRLYTEPNGSYKDIRGNDLYRNVQGTPDPNTSYSEIMVKLYPVGAYDETKPILPFDDTEFVHKPRLENKATFTQPTTYPYILGRFNPDHRGYFGTMHESANLGILVANTPSNYIDDRLWHYYKMIERPWVVDNAELFNKGNFAHYSMYDGIVWCTEGIDIVVMGNTFRLRPGEVVYDSSCYPIECRGDMPYPIPSMHLYPRANYVPDQYGKRICSPRLSYNDADYYRAQSLVTNSPYAKFNPIIPINNGYIENGVVFGDVLYYNLKTKQYHLINPGTVLDTIDVTDTDPNDYMNYYGLLNTTNKLSGAITHLTTSLMKRLSRHHFPLRATGPHHGSIRYDASQNRIWMPISNGRLTQMEVLHLLDHNVDRIEYTTDIIPFTKNQSNNLGYSFYQDGIFTLYTLNKRITFKCVRDFIGYRSTIEGLYNEPNLIVVDYSEYGNRPKAVSAQIEFMGRTLEYIPVFTK